MNDLDKTMAFFTALGLMETRRKESENGKFTLVFMASAPGKRNKVSPVASSSIVSHCHRSRIFYFYRSYAPSITRFIAICRLHCRMHQIATPIIARRVFLAVNDVVEGKGSCSARTHARTHRAPYGAGAPEIELTYNWGGEEFAPPSRSMGKAAWSIHKHNNKHVFARST